MATIETSNKNKNENLITRYYRNDFDQCVAVIRKAVKDYGFELVHIDSTFQEILIETNSFTVIMKIKYITPIESGIDLCVTSKSFFKSANTHIKQWYDIFDKSLQFNGKGLY